MARSPRLVVFDMAGTTVEDTGHIPSAFVAAFAAHGLRLDEAQVARVRGASKREAVAALLAGVPDRDTLAPRVYDTFRAALEQAYVTGGIHAIDGAGHIFADLRARGIRVALNTGFDRVIVNALLAALGWTSGVVDAVVCGEDVSRGRPSPDMIWRAMELTAVQDVNDVVNVGDTAMDLRAGHAAGVGWNIGVCSGAHDRATLEREPHTHVIASIRDLPFLSPR